MGATSSTTTEDEKETLTQDISGSEAVAEAKKEETAATVDLAKLEALKLKQKAKQESEKMASKIVGQKTRSINLGVFSSGQAGGKLGQAFYELGYTTVAINTATQDLKTLRIPDSNKLLLDNGLGGGAGKDLSIGEMSAETYREAITELVQNKLGDCQVILFTTSLSGGSGAGSVVPVLDILSQTGKPILVLGVLPMSVEDIAAKSNALETLEKLLGLVRSKKIANLLLVDNAKIEQIYSDANSMNFFDIANKAIVAPIDAFNTFSSMPSSTKALDSAEFLKLILDGEGLTITGSMSVKDYTSETSIAESIVESLSGNLLASGFDLKQAKYAGFILAANESVWNKIPAVSINYSNAILLDICGNPRAVYRGQYVIDSPDDEVKIYSMFSGMGLPEDRVSQLQKEVGELQTKAAQKDEARNLTLQLNNGKNEVVSAAQKIKQQIAAKNSTFGKFVGNTSDRRK